MRNTYFEVVSKDLLLLSKRNRMAFAETNKVPKTKSISLVFIVLSKLKRMKLTIEMTNGNRFFRLTNLQNSRTPKIKKIPKSNKKLLLEYKVANTKIST